MNKLAIILLTRNRVDNVLEIFSDFKKQSYTNFDFYVYDDVSILSESEKLKSIADTNFHVYHESPPHKLSGEKKFDFMVRYVIQKSNPKYIYNFHDDMKVNSNKLLEKLVNYLDQNPLCGAVGSTIYNSQNKMTWGPGIVKVRMGNEYILNESFCVPTKIYQEMCFINRKLVFYGYEYFIFNWLKLNGYTTKIIGEVSITHYSGTVEKGGGSYTNYQNFKDYYRPRTTILIMKLFLKNVSLLKKIIFFKEELSEPIQKLKKYLKKFQIFSFLKTFLILMFGTIAGLLINVRMCDPYKHKYFEKN